MTTMVVGKSRHPRFLFLSDYIIANSYSPLSRLSVHVERYDHRPLISSVVANPISSFDFPAAALLIEQQQGRPRPSLPFSPQQEVSPPDGYCYVKSSHIPALFPSEDMVVGPPHGFFASERKAEEDAFSAQQYRMDKNRSSPRGQRRRFVLLSSLSSQHDIATGLLKTSFIDATPSSHVSSATSCEHEEVQSPRDDVFSSKRRKMVTEDTTHMSEVTTHSNEASTVRPYQGGLWKERYTELVEFKRQHGHCLVPSNYEENPPLAEWVKRQRYQYKLKLLEEHNSMTEERIQKLEKLGFVWNSHDQLWEERYNDLKLYIEINGDCSVPNKYPPDPSLAAWVKRQRRQNKLLLDGKDSYLTPYRLKKLNDIGFFGKDATDTGRTLR